MKSSRLLFAGLLCACSAVLLLAQSLQGIGEGAPNDGIRLAFQTAFTRGLFSSLADLPPAGNVKKLGTTGLVQEFADVVQGANVKHALVLPNSTNTASGLSGEVWQVHGPLYDYWTSVGVATAGYPQSDTQRCPPVITACQYQVFDKSHILFVLTAQSGGNTFLSEGVFFTKWTGSGGMNTFGPAISAVESITSGAKTTATADRQRFSRGEIFSWLTGSGAGRVFGVYEPIFSYYNGLNNGAAGLLGFPTSDETLLANGRRRQTFEGGTIEYAQGQEPTILYPVAAVILSAAGDTVNMKLGDRVEISAATYSAAGELLAGRAISWNTSNSRVVAIDANGARATLRAVGGGSAVVTAVSEGKVSRSLPVFVSAPCCQAGEGAPSAAIGQAFIDALARTRIQVKLPTTSPVRRAGLGYTQEFTSPEGTTRYLLAKPDALGSAFVLTGAILARFLEQGGATGVLGYPVADATAGLRQIFQGGALAGTPVQLVVNPILARWAALGYETGPAGAPTGEPAAALSFTATSSLSQPFGGGTFSYATSGIRAGQVFLVRTQMLTAYRGAGGVSGQLGLPIADESTSAGIRRQEFEGGTLLLDAAGAPQINARARTPQISATPNEVAAGGRVRIAAGGFPAGAQLRVSVSGRPDFLVQTLSGAYAWEMLVPANTPSSLVTLRAADVNGSSLAVGSFVVQASAETLLTLTKLRGDVQSGLPGARLPQAFRIRLQDEFGSPAARVPVRFTASPGAKIELADAATNANGEAQAYLRMPFAETVALATAEAGGRVVTFSARAAAFSFTNFPNFTQAGNGSPLGPGPATIADNGALLVSAANVIRHLQNTGSLPAPNGPADPVLLNGFMRDVCQFDATGAQICDGFLLHEGADPTLNLWRLGSFTGSPVQVTPLASTTETVRDQLALGRPVLLAMNLSLNGAPAGVHFAAAIGVNSTGGILVRDPNPRLARPAFEDYAAGFTAPAGIYKAALAAAFAVEPQTVASPAFLVSGLDISIDVSSVNGRCGQTLAWPSRASTGTGIPSGESKPLAFRACDGLEAVYQLDTSSTAERALLLTGLGSPASRQGVGVNGAASYAVTRSSAGWTAGNLTVVFTSASVVNAASFKPDLSPGALASAFGSGLASPAGPTRVEVAGVAAQVLAGFPFQLNFVIPPGTSPGPQTLQITSPYGSSTQTIEIRAVSPAIFLLGSGAPAAVNQNGSLNTPDAPATRGQAITLYATGLGDVERRGSLDYVVTTVEATLEGRALTVQFAGLAPGFSGLYQINLIIPSDTPPGLTQELRLRAAETDAPPISIAVQ